LASLGRIAIAIGGTVTVGGVGVLLAEVALEVVLIRLLDDVRLVVGVSHLRLDVVVGGADLGAVRDEPKAR